MREEKLKEIKEHPERRHTFEGLQRCCFHGGALDTQLMDAHETYARTGTNGGRNVIGEIVGHFEYNGTVDVARAKIFAVAEERDAAWRESQSDPCACHGSDVTLVTEGFRWDARACLDHGFIVYGCSPIYGQEEDE